MSLLLLLSLPLAVLPVLGELEIFRDSVFWEAFVLLESRLPGLSALWDDAMASSNSPGSWEMEQIRAEKMRGSMVWYFCTSG